MSFAVSTISTNSAFALLTAISSSSVIFSPFTIGTNSFFLTMSSALPLFIKPFPTYCVGFPTFSLLESSQTCPFKNLKISVVPPPLFLQVVGSGTFAVPSAEISIPAL